VNSTTGKTRVFVAGHRGMVGSAIVRKLEQDSSVDIITRGRDELDLLNQAQVQQFFAETPIDQVYVAAAKVGGIHANNTYPAEFIYENLIIECNIIHSAFQAGVKRLLFLGSSCIYPREASQPMQEDLLLTGKLEPTNEPYAIAKIAGIKLCESFNRQYFDSHGIDYRSVMPTNLYGRGDNYDLENSHVIPALIHRFHAAKLRGESNVSVWGTGTPKREFLYVDDMAAACVFVMNLDKGTYYRSIRPMCSHINVGSGDDFTIQEVAEAVAKIVDYRGDIVFDHNKPDGAPRKLMDGSLVHALGWRAEIDLESGLRMAYNDFLQNGDFSC